MIKTSGSIDIRICMAPPDDARVALLAAAGCSYYEPRVAGVLMTESQEVFDEQVEQWRNTILPARCANVFLPPELKVVGPEVDWDRFTWYVDEALRRVDAVGIEIVVFGSGASRTSPVGFRGEEARRQFNEALEFAATAARPGTIICLEHLCAAETNVVNTLADADAGAIVEALGLERLALVVDAYHLHEEGEASSVVRDVSGKVAHVHVCDPARSVPSGADHDGFVALFEVLAEFGYSGHCSIECTWHDIDARLQRRLLPCDRRRRTAVLHQPRRTRCVQGWSRVSGVAV